MAIKTSDGQEFGSLAEALEYYATDNAVKIIFHGSRTYIGLFGDIDINDDAHLPYATLPKQVIEVE